MNVTAHSSNVSPAWVDEAQLIARSVARHPLASPLRAAVAFFAPPRINAAGPSGPVSPAKPLLAIAPKRITPFGSRAANDAHNKDARMSESCLPASSSAARPSSSPAVRVVRMLEPELPRGAAGRMRISGRIDHVCAELDRLAALEASEVREARAA
jgi:hypothetical protein